MIFVIGAAYATTLTGSSMVKESSISRQKNKILLNFANS